jgi:hypothetical protein
VGAHSASALPNRSAQLTGTFDVAAGTGDSAHGHGPRVSQPNQKGKKRNRLSTALEPNGLQDSRQSRNVRSQWFCGFADTNVIVTGTVAG